MSEVLPRTDDEDTAGFWQAAKQGRLVVQKGTACGEVRFPPHPYCGKCRSTGHDWLPVSGFGRVWTYAFVYKPMLPAFEKYTPFPIVYVELEDHPPLRMAGNLVAAPDAEINSVDHDKVKVGLRVKVVFRDRAEDVALPYWMPVEEGA